MFNTWYFRNFTHCQRLLFFWGLNVWHGVKKLLRDIACRSGWIISDSTLIVQPESKYPFPTVSSVFQSRNGTFWLFSAWWNHRNIHNEAQDKSGRKEKSGDCERKNYHELCKAIIVNYLICILLRNSILLCWNVAININFDYSTHHWGRWYKYAFASCRCMCELGKHCEKVENFCDSRQGKYVLG